MHPDCNRAYDCAQHLCHNKWPALGELGSSLQAPTKKLEELAVFIEFPGGSESRASAPRSNPDGSSYPAIELVAPFATDHTSDWRECAGATPRVVMGTAVTRAAI